MLSCFAAGVTACLSNERPEPPGTAVTWDFPLERPGAAVVLWPPSGAARRRNHQVRSDPAGDALVTTGRDPYLAWQLGTPLVVPAVRAEVESPEGGRFQAFWTCLECPTFSEQCSASETVGPGRATLGFLVAARDPVRDVRLDFPEKSGQTLRLLSVAVASEPALDAAWVPGSIATELESRPIGLVLTARAPDPWMYVSTPGLRATRADAVEVTLRAPGGPPQLYWTGPCKNFEERCSVRLSAVDSGALTHRASLAGVPTWKGEITAVRFDPGPGAGEYRIERISLVHD